MAVRTVRVTLPDGKTVEVPFTDSNDEWVDVRLEHGSTVRVETVVSSTVRANSQYVLDGKPIYLPGPAVSIVRQILSFLSTAEAP
jgi:hypothetical protein